MNSSKRTVYRLFEIPALVKSLTVYTPPSFSPQLVFYPSAVKVIVGIPTTVTLSPMWNFELLLEYRRRSADPLPL